MSKFTGVFIKWTIFLAANAYIAWKLFSGHEPFSFSMFGRSLTFPDAGLWLFLLLALMPLNWLLESLKWRYLLRSVHIRLSLSQSMVSVLNGLALGIFTPNRVGEFAGKVLLLEPSARPEATMMSVFSSLTQLLITVFMAILAVGIHIWIYIGRDETVDEKLSGFSELLSYAVVFVALSFLFIYFLSFLTKADWMGKKLSSFLSAARIAGIKPAVWASVYSLVRYLVFMAQYWIVLYWFGITDPDWKAWILIPLIFFSTSIIPGIMVFPIDVSIRGATSIFFLSAICADEEAILFASLLIWVVNLAIPASVGSVLLLKNKLKLRNEHN